MVEKGEFLAEESSVCEIVNTSTLKSGSKFRRRISSKLSKGQTAQITIPSFPNGTFSGKINAIGEKADNAMKFDVESW
jgi:multidrug resistance efflux pump